MNSQVCQFSKAIAKAIALLISSVELEKIQSDPQKKSQVKAWDFFN